MSRDDHGARIARAARFRARIGWIRSIRARHWPRPPKGSPALVSLYAVLRVLVDYATDDPTSPPLSWPSIGRIRSTTGLARDTISKALDRLQELGLIIREDDRRGLGGATAYRLCIPVDGGGSSPASGPLPGDRSSPASGPLPHERSSPISDPKWSNPETEVVQSEPRSSPELLDTNKEQGTLEAAARVRAREAPAADSPIPITDYRPTAAAIEAALAGRPDLVGHVDAILAKMRQHPWKRRRTVAEWDSELQAWIAREDAPPATTGPTDADLAERIARLLRPSSPEWRAQQLDGDPALAALFAGGDDQVANLLERGPAAAAAELRRLRAEHAGRRPPTAARDPERQR